MKTKLERWAPPGLNYRAELEWIAGGVATALLVSLNFFASYSNRYRALFQWYPEHRVLLPGAVMPDFVEVLNVSLIGFIILPICMIAVLIYHYAYYYKDSKSIYLMKRLPSRWELWRRCIALPAAAAFVSLLAAAVLLLIYYCYYMARTPAACLTQFQWQKIWSVLLGAST